MNAFVKIDEKLTESLFNNDEQASAIHVLKNAVIGSNRQKSAVINQGVLPQLCSIISNPSVDLGVRLDTAIVLGSIAKGTSEHIASLLYYGVVDSFLTVTINSKSPDLLVGHCLNALSSIVQFNRNPVEQIYSNEDYLKCLIEMAKNSESDKIKSCIIQILTPTTTEEQMALFEAGILPILTHDIMVYPTFLKLPSLVCLASLCFSNKPISVAACEVWVENMCLVNILNLFLSRTHQVPIQLSAARCLTYLYRCDAISTQNYIVTFRLMPCLARLCSVEQSEKIRISAANYLAHLIELSPDLQNKASISHHLIESLTQLLKSSSLAAKESSLKCVAAICANNEEIRKKIIDKQIILDEILHGINSPHSEVCLAAIKCLHSLSRSVQLLRTTFQDHLIWPPLLNLFHSQPLPLFTLKVLSAVLCNLLLDFSPTKDSLLQNGVLELFIKLTSNSDATLRLNGSWGLMNMAFMAEENLKQQIISTLGAENLYRLLNDADVNVVLKTLGLLRNILSDADHIKNIMENNSFQFLKAVAVVLENNRSTHIQEQALCIVSNIILGSKEINYILDDSVIMSKITELLESKEVKLQSSAVLVLSHFLQNQETHEKLQKYGTIDKLRGLIQQQQAEIR